ncbi:MAG: dihydroneopterin aldolase [Actinomycetota bacterium]
MTIVEVDGRALDRIAVQGIQAFGWHGVLPAERENGQDFLVDVELHIDASAAARSDNVADTAHYGDVAQRVANIVAGPAVDLIETLAHTIASVILTEWPIVRVVDVVVHKPAAPIPVPGQVSIAIRRYAP